MQKLFSGPERTASSLDITFISKHKWKTAALTLLITLTTSMANAQVPENVESRWHQEVVALHVVIEQWLTGDLPDTDEAYSPFSDAMADSFEIVSPTGVRSDRATIVASLRSAHGVQQEGFSIAIKNLRTRSLASGFALVTYEEWQTAGDRTTARFSSVWLREDSNTPRGIAWLHLQETWLPGLSPTD